MDAEALLDQFAAGLGEFLAERGFEADEWTFRRYGAHGDALIVEFQQAELWTDREACFYVNLFFSLRPKWESDRVRFELDEDEPPRGSLGTMLGRLDPGDPDETWRIADPATMAEVGDRLREQLDEVLPAYTGLLDRTELVARTGEIWRGGSWRIEAWLLAERGPSAELERLLSARETPDADLGHITGPIRAYALTRA
jgi:hypothetical protein